MNEKTPFVPNSSEFRSVFEAWRKAGLIPPMVKRMIIDIQEENIVSVYYSCYADIKLFTPELVAGLQNADFRNLDNNIPVDPKPKDTPVDPKPSVAETTTLESDSRSFVRTEPT